MAPVFRLDMLPGREGDCLILTYGDETRVRRVMVDTGRKSTWRSVGKRLAAVQAEHEYELLIVSHVDRDHIAGVLSMLSDPKLQLTFNDIWFNGFQHLHDAGIESFGPVQGEELSQLLSGMDGTWNKRFGGKSVELDRAQDPLELEGGLTLRLLSPDRAALRRLIDEWEDACKAAGIVAGARARPPGPPAGFESFGGPIDVDELAKTPFEPDGSKPNATSIAVLAEFAGRRVLLAADGGDERLRRSIEPLAEAEGGRLALAAFKVPHHGSKYNLSSKLLGLLECRRFLISTNGSYFKHPDREAIARVLKRVRSAELVFNYASEQTLAWDDDDLKAQWGYTPTYPADGENGSISVNLLD